MGKSNHAGIVGGDLLLDVAHVHGVWFAKVHYILHASIQDNAVEIGVLLNYAEITKFSI